MKDESKTVFDYNLIIASLIFLIIMRLTAWIISNHRFQTLTFIGLYVIAISPNLVNLSWNVFAFDQLIMAFFDSIFIFILFSIYIGVLILMNVIDKGWLSNRLKRKLISKGEISARSSEDIKNLVKNTIAQDLIELEDD